MQASQVIWASDIISQSAHRKSSPNKNPYRAAARACKCKNTCKYGGIVGVVFLKIEYIRREFTSMVYSYSHSTLGAGFVLPNGISAGVYFQLRGFKIFFYAAEGMNNLLYPLLDVLFGMIL